MNNVSKQIRQAYYDVLNGEISVEVYKEDVPESENSHHVILRVESETDNSHKSGWVTKPIVITEVVLIGQNSIDPDEADDIDDEIRNILLPTIGARSLEVEGIQITNIKPESSTTINEDDGTKRYYRKITRWTQRVSHS